MTIVRARVRVEGFEKAREGMALVDTGASVTILDRGVAEDIGVEITKMKRALVTASGHRVEGVVGILRKMALEEELPYAYVLLASIPKQVAEILEEEGLENWIIVGVTALELAGYAVDPRTGTLRKTELLLI